MVKRGGGGDLSRVCVNSGVRPTNGTYGYPLLMLQFRCNAKYSVRQCCLCFLAFAFECLARVVHSANFIIFPKLNSTIRSIPWGIS